MAKPPIIEAIDKAAGPSGRSTLERFCEAVEAGSNPDARIMSFLGEAFREILEGMEHIEGGGNRRAEKLGQLAVTALDLALSKRGGQAKRLADLTTEGRAVFHMIDLIDNDGVDEQRAKIRCAEIFDMRERDVAEWYKKLAPAIRGIVRDLERPAAQWRVVDE